MEEFCAAGSLPSPSHPVCQKVLRLAGARAVALECGSAQVFQNLEQTGLPWSCAFITLPCCKGGGRSWGPAYALGRLKMVSVLRGSPIRKPCSGWGPCKGYLQFLPPPSFFSCSTKIVLKRVRHLKNKAQNWHWDCSCPLGHTCDGVWTIP